MKNNWKKFRLGDILEKIIGGGTPSRVVDEFWNGDIPWATVKDMKDGVYKLSGTQEKITDQGVRSSATNIIPKNTVIISTRMGLGRCFIGQVAMAINQDLKALIPNDNVDVNFLLWLLVSKTKDIEVMGTGTTVKGIRLEELKNIEIIIPEKIEEQKKIASILSAYDDLIENNSRRIKILEEMAQAIYKEWFVEFKFPEYEKVKMVEGELGLMPEGWDVATVSDITKRVPSGKKYENKTANASGMVPILDQGKSGFIGYHDDEPGVLASEENPIIVFANHTCYQNLIMFPFSTIQNILPFYPNDENSQNIFWLHWATKDLIKFNDYKGHWPEFIGKKLLLPKKELCEKFGEIIKPMIIEKYKLEKYNNNLCQTRDLLLPKLMGGLNLDL